MNKKFEEYTVTELKALAYDELAKLEATQNNLKIINSRISEILKIEPESIVEEKPKNK